MYPFFLACDTRYLWLYTFQNRSIETQWRAPCRYIPCGRRCCINEINIPALTNSPFSLFVPEPLTQQQPPPWGAAEGRRGWGGGAILCPPAPPAITAAAERGRHAWSGAVRGCEGPWGAAMVRLHVKRGDESQFLLEAACGARLAELAPLVARIYNGRLKVQRLCAGTGRHPASPPPWGERRPQGRAGRRGRQRQRQRGVGGGNQGLPLG